MFLFLGMGAAVGFLSGMFGVGGGFLLTPLLIFSGISAGRRGGDRHPADRRLLDFRRALLLAAAAHRREDDAAARRRRHRRLGARRLSPSERCATSASSISSSRSPTSPSSAPSARSCCANRCARSGARASGRAAAARRPGQHNWIHGLPLKMRFRRSKLYVSVIPSSRSAPASASSADLGHRRRLHHGAGADLPAAGADQRRRRHLAAYTLIDDGASPRSCTRRPTRPSTSCSRSS